MKCSICGAKIEKTFLEKIMGGYVKDKKGKKHVVCPECQRKLKTKQEILEKI